MPIQFACPHCGKQTTVADQYAGQSGPCAACGQTVTVPYAAAPVYAIPPRSSGGGAGTVLVVVGAVLLGGFLMCGCVASIPFLPGVGTARSAARRVTSANNLKQIGIAIHSYHDTYGELPPAVVKDQQGKPLYSGFVHLLPFLEQDNLYRQFDKSKSWDDPANLHLSNQALRILEHPSSLFKDPGHSDYLLIGGPNAVLGDDGQRHTLVNVASADGTSNTIMALEVATSQASESWAKPVTWDPSQPFDSPDANVVQVLFVDGSVRALPKSTPVHKLRLIADYKDGQIVNVP